MTFLTMLLAVSSTNSMRTCWTAPREPVRPRIFMTRTYLGWCCLTSTARDRENHNANGKGEGGGKDGGEGSVWRGTACRDGLFILLFLGLLGFLDHDGWSL